MVRSGCRRCPARSFSTRARGRAALWSGGARPSLGQARSPERGYPRPLALRQVPARGADFLVRTGGARLRPLDVDGALRGEGADLRSADVRTCGDGAAACCGGWHVERAFKRLLGPSRQPVKNEKLDISRNLAFPGPI